MGFTGSFGAKRPFSRKASGEALAEYVAQRWPRGRRDAVRAEWGLSDEVARSICEGTPSKRTLDHVLQHDRGGWILALFICERVIGQSLDTFIEIERARLRNERQRTAAAERGLVEMARDLRVALDLGVQRGGRRPALPDRQPPAGAG